MSEDTISTARPIADTLRRLGRGVLMDEASEEMQKLVKAVDASGKQGTLAIILTVKKASHSGAMVVSGKTKLGLPKQPDYEALFFGTPDGNLLAEDPKQEKIQFGVVPAPQDKMAKIG